MHLLYARFFVKAMRDMGVFAEPRDHGRARARSLTGSFDEPFMLLRNQGQILGRSAEATASSSTVEWDRTTVSSALRSTPWPAPTHGGVSSAS